VIRTFSIGILLGIAIVAGLLYVVPVVEQHREASLISVQPNGGNAEAFHINLPDDRILRSPSDNGAVEPDELKWPDDSLLQGAQTEVFKIRNRNEAVVGVASRVAGTAGGDRFVEWTLHLPARGSLYLAMQPSVDEAGNRNGNMLAGTREFAKMHGSVRERLLAAAEETGRIELVTALAARMDESQ
jgi:hypothetical protein